MDLTELFQQAKADSKNLTEKPSNDVLLQLYSLYKQATEGDNHTEAPSNMFDFVAKAKHDAWLAQKGKSSADAMKEYIALVDKLKA